jgi:hypothetical protein
MIVKLKKLKLWFVKMVFRTLRIKIVSILKILATKKNRKWISRVVLGELEIFRVNWDVINANRVTCLMLVIFSAMLVFVLRVRKFRGHFLNLMGV